MGSDLIIGVATFIDDTEEKAMVHAKKYFEENMKMFGPLGLLEDYPRTKYLHWVVAPPPGRQAFQP
ncbi:MAG: hypothetical protein CM1200mP27_08770 [Chloroflexota bacterium]|nr:MAG: hypothetical protein CM1200mP27_08770 [Chloroflexota bacterium]